MLPQQHNRLSVLTCVCLLQSFAMQVGKAYLALAALLYQEGSFWSLSMAHRAQQRAAHIMQGMQQAAAATATCQAAQNNLSMQAMPAMPAGFPAMLGAPQDGAAQCGRTAAKGMMLQQGDAAAMTAALAAAAAAGDIADAVVRVVVRQPAVAAVGRSPKVA
jgi:hypothetical protein